MAQPASAFEAVVAPVPAAQFSSETPAPAPDCQLYPLALSTEVLAEAEVGINFLRVPLGNGTGNFSFLSWAGVNDADVFAAAIAADGGAAGYVNPEDPADSQLDLGDWVQGLPGVKNSSGVRANLDALIGAEIAVPTWSELRGEGDELDYSVDGFARIKLLSYKLSGKGWISFEYVGDTQCYIEPETNQLPLAEAQALDTDSETPILIVLEGSDADGDAITFDLASQPANGALWGTAPQLTYVSDADYIGPDSFEFTVNDGSDDSQLATVSIDVARPNDAPVITSTPSLSGQLGDPYDYAVAAVDPDGDALAYTLATTEPGLTVDPATGLVSGLPQSSAWLEAVGGPDPACKSFDRSVSELNMELGWHWRSPINGLSSTVMGTPVVARIVDINGDGVVDELDPPTVVFAAFLRTWSDGAYVVAVNGETGATLWISSRRRVSGFSSPAVGDIDGDGRLDIVYVGAHDRTELVAFDHTGALKWIAPTGPVSPHLPLRNAWDWVSLADLDADGDVEVVHGNRVFDGAGNLLWIGADTTGGHSAGGVGSIVADLDQDGFQEVIAGRTVYTHDGQIKSTNPDLPEFAFNAIGDFDGDGDPEIVVNGTGGSSGIFLVDHEMNVIWGPVEHPGASSRVGGPPTVADFDGDGHIDIGIAGESRYATFDRNGDVVWSQIIQDYSSAVTGSSVFDFDGDGRASVVFADEYHLYVLDGPTGVPEATFSNRSGTAHEFPIVVDSTGDGLANIIVPATQTRLSVGGVRMYQSADLSWMPTRSIWNQHAYSIGNVNDDGTIPAHPEPSWQTHNTFRLNSQPDRTAYGLSDISLGGLSLTGGPTYHTLNVTVESRGLADYPGQSSVEFFAVDAAGVEVSLGEVAVPELVRGSSHVAHLVGVNAADVEGKVVKAVLREPAGMTQCDNSNDWAAAQAVTVTAEDPFGLADSQIYLLKLHGANTAPTISSAAVQAVEARTLYEYPVVATDADRGDSIHYTLLDSPTGMWINGVTGQIVWKTGDEGVGDHLVTVQVEDIAGAIDVQTFTLTVGPSLNPQLPPSIVSDAPTRATVNGEYRYQVQAPSPDGLPVEFSLAVRPVGMTIDSVTGEIVWTPSAFQSGEAFVVVRAIDSNLHFDLQEFVLIIASSDTNEAPHITSATGDFVLAGEVFSYQAQAVDFDGDTVAFAVQGAPAGLAINATTGLVTWNTAGVTSAQYSFTLVASDARGGIDYQVVTVSVNSGANVAPEATSTPNTIVGLGETWTYTFAAIDGDADVLTYSVEEGPTGLTIDAVTGEALWDASGAQPGEHPVALQATDGRGGFATQTFILQLGDLTENFPPTIASMPAVSLIVGSEWQYTVLASDTDGDAVTVIVTEGPVGMAVEGANTVTWTPGETDAGAHTVTIEAHDGLGGVARQFFTVYVAPVGISIDLAPPTISVGSVYVEPGTLVQLPVSASDASSILSLFLTVDGIPIDISAAGIAEFVAGEAGAYPMVVSATDGAFNSAVVSTWMIVGGVADGVAPEAFFGGPETGEELRTATSLVGTANDANLLRWELTATPVSPAGSASIIIGSGTDPVVDGELGVFDPSALAGGEWYLQLEVFDQGGLISTIGYVVSSVNEAKYGLFSMTFTDAVVPVAGMPITIQRTYNSGASTRPGDFGFGWDLSLQTLMLETDYAPGVGWDRENQGTILPNWVLLPATSHTVTILDGASESIVFDFTPRFLDPVFDGRYVSAEWTERTSTGATLTPLDSTELFQNDGRLLSLDNLETFVPEGYRVTMADGREFTFSLEDGLTNVRDANGNTLTISDSGITSSAGASIALARDPQGRITSVTTPGGLVTQYRYDGAGDLVAVTDPEGYVTNYAYNSKHYLTGIIDPLGRVPARNEYDEDGRLVAIVDAQGNRIEINADPDARTQTVTDRLGNVTVQTFDAGGYLIGQVFADGTTESYANDALGNRTSRTDGLGNTWTATYDASQNRTSVTDPLGNTKTWTYDASNRLISATDALGRTTAVTYDARGNATTVTYPDGTQVTFTYDAAGNPLTETDESGRVTTNGYDATGRMTSTTSPGGSVTSYTYDADGRVSTVTDAEGGVTARTYDGRGLITGSTDALGALSQSGFDALGQRTSYVDAVGGTSSMAYDELGRMTSRTSPTADVSTYVYDAEGRMVGSTSPDGVVRTTAYDVLGRVLNSKVDGVTVSSRTYDAAGRVVTATNATGATTTYTYDAAGRSVGATYADGTATATVFDAAGQVLSMTSTAGTVSYAYDSRGRATSVTATDGAVTGYSYDAAGRVLTQTAPDGAVTTFTYDADGRMASASDPLGNTAQVSYDGNGQRVSVVDPLGRTRVWTLDAVGRLLTYSVAGQSQLTQIFDAAGRLTSRTLGDGTITAYTYDAAGRLTVIDYADRVDATFTYTDAGRRATVTDQRGTTSYGYDSQGRLTSVASPEGNIGYGYDAASRLTSITTAAGTTSYTRDALGRISGVTDPDGGVYLIARDSAGRVSAVTYPNGVTESFTRDDAGRAMAVTVTDALGTVLASHTATRDVAGRITALDDVFDAGVGAANVSRAFGYDAAGRLTQVISDATGSSSTVDYTLDGLGNRASTSTDGTVVASTVNDLDQLTSQGSNAFTYDDASRLTSATGPGGASTYAWSSQGELLNAATPAGTINYVYDTDGNVTTRTETGVAVDFVYDTVSGLPRAVSASDGTWWIYADGMILAQHTATGPTTPGTTAYLHSDVRGDVRTATNTAGTITDTFTWTVDGQQTTRTGTTTVTVGWRSETVDTTTGLIWLRARWYDPTTARFLSADPWHGNPANPISLNRYLYANADPVNMHDPTGMFTTTEQTSAVIPTQGVLYGIRGMSVTRARAIVQAVVDSLAASITLAWSAYAVFGIDDPAAGEDVDRSGSRDEPLPDIEIFERDSNDPELQPAADGAGAQKPPKNCMPRSTPTGVDELVEDAAEWLGAGARVITNAAGDKIFLSADGLRRIRFDINRPSPHLSPHAHVEEKLGGKWTGSGQLYPCDVARR